MSHKRIKRVSEVMLSGTTLTSGTNIVYSGGGGLAATNLNAAIAEVVSDLATATGNIASATADIATLDSRADTFGTHLTYSLIGDASQTIQVYLTFLDGANGAVSGTKRIHLETFNYTSMQPETAATFTLADGGAGSIVTGGNYKAMVLTDANGGATLRFTGNIGRAVWVKATPVVSATGGAQRQAMPVMAVITFA